MKNDLSSLLKHAIEDGVRSIGQILIDPIFNGGFELRHREDAGLSSLELFTGPHAARRLSLTTDAGKYRPLKTAPDLARGWRLLLANHAELRMALDHFYPAMLGVWRSFQRHQLNPVPLRETLERQTGMYAATKRLQDEEGQELIAKTCCSERCQKRVLWPFAFDKPLTHLSPHKCSPTPHVFPDGTTELPLLCHEACNILVAASREVVKKREKANAR